MQNGHNVDFFWMLKWRGCEKKNGVCGRQKLHGEIEQINKGKEESFLLWKMNEPREQAENGIAAARGVVPTL